MSARSIKITAPQAHYPLQIKSWALSQGDTTRKDQLLGTYEYLTDEGYTQKHEIRCQHEGYIVYLMALEGIAEAKDRFLVEMVEVCDHSVQLMGLCALCADYTGSDTTRATINLTHDSKGVKISHKEATRIEMGTIQRLLKCKKLSLLLDLDQTVVHATVDSKVTEWMADQDNVDYPKLDNVHAFTLPESPIVYHIRLRPGTRKFLAEMCDKYEMHIYTMGTRNYANAVAQILDPDKKYFQDRILSRDDSGSFVFKSLKRLFPVDQSMVVAIDDRADVWNWSPNLIKVRPYNYFQGIGDINEPLGQPKVQESSGMIKVVAKESERPEIVDDDNDLKYITRIMITLHAAFYSLVEENLRADVCVILPGLKRNVLEGVSLVFSGVVPVGMDPQQNELWIQAKQFGASCRLEIENTTSHLIARKDGTEKVREAKDMMIFILKPEWLLRCFVEWFRVREEGYYVDPLMQGPLRVQDLSDWSAINMELEEFSDDTDESEETEDDEDWLDKEIEKELESEGVVDPAASKRKFDKIE